VFFELLQTAAQNQPITPATVPDSFHFGTQFGTAAFAVFIIQQMKKWSALPWITHWTPTVNRFVAIVSSLLTAIGVHVAYSSVEHTLVISGLTLTGILGMIVVWAKQFAYQEYVYQSAANRTKVDLPAGAVVSGQLVPPGGALETAPIQPGVVGK
jgi:heme/copper-type cytochrome/quinol oxidase subunit 3